MRKPRCGKGTACGFSCISAEDSCRDKLSTDAVQGLRKLVASEDAAVNTGGFIGSVIGGAVAGRAGALAGDLAGALAVRGLLTVRTAVVEGKARAKRDEAYETASRLEQLRREAGATLAQMRDPAFLNKLADDVTGDVSGWAVGNASATTLSQVDLLAAVPFKGAAVASVTVPRLVRAVRRLRQREFSEAQLMTRDETEALLNRTAASLLAALQEALPDEQPERLTDFSTDGGDLIGLFETRAGKRMAFRMTETEIQYAETT